MAASFVSVHQASVSTYPPVPTASMRSSRICEWSEVSGPAGRGTLYHRLARDLPTALLVTTQHYFDLAIVSSQLREPGEGWPLARSSAFDVSTIVRLGPFARHRSGGRTGSNRPWRSRALRAADDESVPNQDERANTGVNNDFSPTIQILSGDSFRGTALASCVSSMFH